MISVRRALGLSLAERYVMIAIGLLGTMLIARLLTPEEIGIYSVSLAVIGIAQVLRDFGIGNYLIQEKNLTEEHIRTAFGLGLLIGISLFIIVTLAAPSFGRFYNDERLVQTMRLSALNFIVLPFCSISLALLRRNMLFNRIVTVNLIAATGGLVITLSLAYSGFGPNSIAIGAVAANVLIGIGAWIARTDRKLLLPGFSEWRAVMSFGGQSSIAGVVTTVAVDINDLVIGKLLGFGPVAMLSRAQGVMYLFQRDIMAALRNVAYPAFSRAHREGESLESRYLESVSSVTVIAWPFYGFASLYALELLRLLFGPQWDEAATLVPFFCIAGAFAATSNLILTAIMAVGRIDLVTKAELIFQPFRAVLIAGAAIIWQTLIACAAAFLIAFIIHTPFVYAFKARCIPNDYRALLANLWLSAKVTLGTLIGPAGIVIYAGIDRNEPVSLVLFGIAVATGLTAWLVSLIVFRHPISVDPLFIRLTSRLPRFI